MDLVIGIILIVSFFGVLVYSLMRGDISSTRTMIQLIVSGVGSIIVLSPLSLKAIKKLSTKKEDSSKTEKEREEMDKKEEACCFDKEDMGDFKALSYLKERAIEIKSKEALDLVVKLNNVLFANDLSIEEEGEKQDANKV